MAWNLIFFAGFLILLLLFLVVLSAECSLFKLLLLPMLLPIGWLAVAAFVRIPLVGTSVFGLACAVWFFWRSCPCFRYNMGRCLYNSLLTVCGAKAGAASLICGRMSQLRLLLNLAAGGFLGSLDAHDGFIFSGDGAKVAIDDDVAEFGIFPWFIAVCCWKPQ
ncbi:hypothetical protein U1Q18_000019 [Sarracenia purpurea var. burkii]